MSPEEEDIRNRINDSARNRRHKETALLWGELLEVGNYNWDDYYKYIEALWRVHDWDLADKVADLGICANPSQSALYYASGMTALQGCRWECAVSRFEELRNRFGAFSDQNTYRSIYWQLVAYGEMFTYERSRDFVRGIWPVLKKQNPLYHDALHLMHIWLEPSCVGEFAAWSTPCLPPEQRDGYAARIAIAQENMAFLSKLRSKIPIISLGQSCLPFVIPLRWGLKPDVFEKSASMPFDLTGSLEDSSASLVSNGFSDMVDSDHLFITNYNNAPIAVNRKYNMMFFHEKGIWWEKNGWERLRNVYATRVENFLSVKRNGRALYVFCLAGKGLTSVIVSSYLRHLDDAHSHLLIINVTSESIEDATEPRVTIMNHPFPDDYNWNVASEYESERGLRFEQEIVNAIVAQIVALDSIGDTA